MNLGSYRRLLVFLGVAALCWNATASPANASAPDAAQIVIKNFMFMPSSLTVKAGSTVTWANKDDEPHTVVSDIALFRSGAVDTEETFSFKFSKPGVYHFSCSIHPQMIGTIVVE